MRFPTRTLAVGRGRNDAAPPACRPLDAQADAVYAGRWASVRSSRVLLFKPQVTEMEEGAQAGAFKAAEGFNTKEVQASIHKVRLVGVKLGSAPCATHVTLLPYTHSSPRQQVLTNCLQNQPFLHARVPTWSSTIVENCLKELANTDKTDSAGDKIGGNKFKYVGALQRPRLPAEDAFPQPAQDPIGRSPDLN